MKPHSTELRSHFPLSESIAYFSDECFPEVWIHFNHRWHTYSKHSFVKHVATCPVCTWEVVTVPPTTGSFSSRVQEAYCGMLGNPCCLSLSFSLSHHTHTILSHHDFVLLRHPRCSKFKGLLTITLHINTQCMRATPQASLRARDESCFCLAV